MMVIRVPLLDAHCRGEPCTLEPLPDIRRELLGHEHVHITHGSSIGVGIQVCHQSLCSAFEQHVRAAQLVENPSDGVTLGVHRQVSRGDSPGGRCQPNGERSIEPLQSVQLFEATMKPERAALERHQLCQAVRSGLSPPVPQLGGAASLAQPKSFQQEIRNGNHARPAMARLAASTAAAATRRSVGERRLPRARRSVRQGVTPLRRSAPRRSSPQRRSTTMGRAARACHTGRFRVTETPALGCDRRPSSRNETNSGTSSLSSWRSSSSGWQCWAASIKVSSVAAKS